MRFIQLIRQYLFERNAATAIEYGLIAAAIALALAVVVFVLGDTIFSVLWEDIPAALQNNN